MGRHAGSRAAQALREAGATEIEVRLFLTFNAAMDRARDADFLADAGLAMWREQRWMFNPEKSLIAHWGP
jgi:hypothetical protein